MSSKLSCLKAIGGVTHLEFQYLGGKTSNQAKPKQKSCLNFFLIKKKNGCGDISFNPSFGGQRQEDWELKVIADLILTGQPWIHEAYFLK